MAPIGSVLQVFREPVDRAKLDFADLQPITIHFDGSVDRREVKPGHEYKMDLLFARPGNVVVAKIDLKNDAVGIVPDWSDVVVTNHFAVYEPDCSRLVPEYLILVIQADFFKAYLWRNKVGAEGRKEVKLDFFESILIPLPPLDTQRAIVARWQAAQTEIAALTNSIEDLTKRVAAKTKQSLGREPAAASERPMIFALRFRYLERWGADVSWRNVTQTYTAKYPIVHVSDLCKISSGGTPSRSISEFFGGNIPWVKTTEVRDAVIYETGETLTQLGLENSSARIYPRGSLLVAMYGQGATRGRTAKLGIAAATNQACAVLTGFRESVEPDFLWFYLMSEYDNLRDLASGNNQPNLNAEMIATYPVPLPPLAIQREIVRQVEAGRAEVARLREQTAQRAKIAKADIEATILGRAS